jgi:hypothetical protein
MTEQELAELEINLAANPDDIPTAFAASERPPEARRGWIVAFVAAVLGGLVALWLLH